MKEGRVVSWLKSEGDEIEALGLYRLLYLGLIKFLALLQKKSNTQSAKEHFLDPLLFLQGLTDLPFSASSATRDGDDGEFY